MVKNPVTYQAMIDDWHFSPLYAIKETEYIDRCKLGPLTCEVQGYFCETSTIFDDTIRSTELHVIIHLLI